MEASQTAMGFGHFIAQSDVVGKGLLLVLIAMSIASWTLIVVKGLASWRRGRHGREFLSFFWDAPSLDAVSREIQTRGARCPFSLLTLHAQHAREHYASYGAAKLSEAGTQQEFLIRTMNKVIDETSARLENGLSVLATVSSTAPFIGLFGTVWGIYHALTGMAGAGQITIERVAGPVGEALIMTAAGLAVAIPAVLAYNVYGRILGNVEADLEGFAHDLRDLLADGPANSLADGSADDLAAGPLGD